MSRRSARIVEIVAVVAALALAGWLRLAELDRHLVADELRWVCRSISFHEALVDGRWADTFQVGHPGVITMWLGALALPLDEAGQWRELCPQTDGGRDLSKLDDVGQEGLLQTVAPRLYAARRGVAVGSLLVLLALYLLLRTAASLPFAPAFGGWALVAFDPFLLAHSRVLHLDALTALLSLCAVVALGAATRPDRSGTRWAAVAGALAGLAMLNKVSALVLGPFALAWFAWRAWQRERRRPVLARFVVWTAAAGLVYVLAWPSMWVAPVSTVTGVLTKAQEEGANPHESGNYFLGQPVDDPGPLFYPVAGAFRLTPWALLGLAAALAWLWRTRRLQSLTERVAVAPERDLLLRLLAWTLVFALFMTMGPKKFDRYLLPALAALNLAAGVGIVMLTRQMADRRAARRKPDSSSTADTPAPRIGGGGWGAGAAVTLALLQLLAATRSMPYPLAYYNPLLGGAPAAVRALLVGWGEGYDLAADWLNAQPEAADLEAAARSVTVFGPQFAGRTRSAEGYRPGRTDYVVLYLNQVQRRRNESLVAAYQDNPAVQPAFVGRIAGIDYVWVYANDTLAPLQAALAARVAPGDVVVADGDGVLARAWTGPQPLVRYWGHWGPAEMEEALAKDFPADWHRAWVVRYPGQDPEVALQVLGEVATAGEMVPVADGVVEITPFER